jgi:hypothetical protein
MLGRFGGVWRDQFELDDARYKASPTRSTDSERVRFELARGREQGSDLGLDL